MQVVLVHGIFDDGRMLLPLARRLEQAGHACLLPRLTPCDARHGLDDLAVKLRQQIDAALGIAQPLVLIGFSMGSLIARHYLQTHGGAARCRAFCAIAGPLHGTRVAWLYPGQGARDMRPGSPWLTALQENEPRLGQLPCHSFRTPLDLMIQPSSSSHWPRADNHVVWCLLHRWMVNNRRITRHLEQLLQEVGAPQPTGGPESVPQSTPSRLLPPVAGKIDQPRIR